MKTQILLSILMLGLHSAFAADTAVKSSNPPTKDSQMPAVKPGGPVGYGPLKLGMTKDAVAALPLTGDISLADGLVEARQKTPLPIGTVSYRSKLGTPLRSEPYDVSLTFKSDRLASIYITLDDASFALFTKQITERYGNGSVNDTRSEEQCIYRNGSNFTLRSGVVQTNWNEPVTRTEKIQTTLTDLLIDACPSRLDMPRVGPIRQKSLTIETVSVDQSPSGSNPF